MRSVPRRPHGPGMTAVARTGCRLFPVLPRITDRSRGAALEALLVSSEALPAAVPSTSYVEVPVAAQEGSAKEPAPANLDA